MAFGKAYRGARVRSVHDGWNSDPLAAPDESVRRREEEGHLEEQLAPNDQLQPTRASSHL